MTTFTAPGTHGLPPPPTSSADLAAMQPDHWQAVLAAAPAARAAWLHAAAVLGHADAQAVLGQLLLDGNGTVPDAAQALHWFLCAAQQGDTMAMNMAGRCHEQGWGTPADAGKAAAWYRQAAQRGLAEARYNLANLLATGQGVPRDHAQAFALYQQAAQQGFAKAHTKLGRYHEDGCAFDGLQLPVDADAAARCFRLGAEGGDFRGQFNHAGVLAAQGRWDDALHWLQQVPLTAHARYLRQAAAVLLESPHPGLQAVGRDWLAQVGPAAVATAVSNDGLA